MICSLSLLPSWPTRSTGVLTEPRCGVPDIGWRSTRIADNRGNGQHLDAGGEEGKHAARAVMPARQEPRVEAEPYGGPPAVTGPDRVRPQPPELGQAFERALH